MQVCDKVNELAKKIMKNLTNIDENIINDLSFVDINEIIQNTTEILDNYYFEKIQLIEDENNYRIETKINSICHGSNIRIEMLNKKIQSHKEKKWETSNSLLETLDGTLDHTKLQYTDTYFALEDLMHYGQHLTLNQRKWLMGVFYQEMTLRDISLEHSVSLAAVKSWRKSAVKKLKQMEDMKKAD